LENPVKENHRTICFNPITAAEAAKYCYIRNMTPAVAANQPSFFYNTYLRPNGLRDPAADLGAEAPCIKKQTMRL
jgi:hypothetical protein